LEAKCGNNAERYSLNELNTEYTYYYSSAETIDVECRFRCVLGQGAQIVVQ